MKVVLVPQGVQVQRGKGQASARSCLRPRHLSPGTQAQGRALMRKPHSVVLLLSKGRPHLAGGVVNQVYSSSRLGAQFSEELAHIRHHRLGLLPERKMASTRHLGVVN
jgi:hypothetical protein